MLLKKLDKMEDIFEEIHYDFINSDDYFYFIKEMIEYDYENSLKE